MPVAYLPSPASGQWHVGPVPIHLFAVCVVVGVLAALAMAEHRYRAAGGRPWVMTDIAAVAVPAALVGGLGYHLAAEALPGQGWAGIFRSWDGGLGLPGAVVCGLVVTVAWCRRLEVSAGPVLSAALPGLLVGQAVAVLGNWCTQTMYGPPSAAFWAVAISPWRRIPGYESFTSFQPVFFYEALWCALAAAALIGAIERLRLTGLRALVLCVALEAAGWLATGWLVLGGPPLPVVRAGQAVAVLTIAGSALYLWVTRAVYAPEPVGAGAPRRRRGTTGRGT